MIKVEPAPGGQTTLTFGPVPAVVVVYELEALEPRAIYPDDPEARADLARWLQTTDWGRVLGEALEETIDL